MRLRAAQPAMTMSRQMQAAPALPPECDWVFPNPFYDLANGAISDTCAAGAELPPKGTHGIYPLKLDLFDSSAIR
jgi:hypothetical protein